MCTLVNLLSFSSHFFVFDQLQTFFVVAVTMANSFSDHDVGNPPAIATKVAGKNDSADYAQLRADHRKLQDTHQKLKKQENLLALFAEGAVENALDKLMNGNPNLSEKDALILVMKDFILAGKDLWWNAHVSKWQWEALNNCFITSDQQDVTEDVKTAVGMGDPTLLPGNIKKNARKRGVRRPNNVSGQEATANKKRTLIDE